MSDETRTITYTILAKFEGELFSSEVAEYVAHHDMTEDIAEEEMVARIHADLDVLIAKAHKALDDEEAPND